MTLERRGRPGGAWRWLLAVGCLGLGIPAARAELRERPDVGVRSAVVERNLPGSPDHGRIYSIFSVQTVSSDPDNLPPVDEDDLVLHVCRALDSHGFVPVQKGKTPEILVTVHYGRAWLRNPYLNGIGDSQAIDGGSFEHRPNQNVTGGFAPRMLDSKTLGYESKVQQASYEKLYIRITGWQYPTDPKARALMLWKTTVLVDDPDGWNLNAVAGTMLEAGAKYFDHDITEKEVTVHPPVREGYVRVGTPEVMDPPPPKPAPRAAAPVVAAHSPDERRRQFNLPAGDAATMLQAFSQQSGEEIIYPAEQIRRVRTNGVSGELGTRVALDRMLEGTGLAAVQDEKTGALAVRPVAREL